MLHIYLYIFTVVIGTSPWTESSFNDPAFLYIINGNIKQLLKDWDQYEYLNDDIIQLFDKFFQFESKRISMKEIKACNWLNILQIQSFI